MPLPVETAPPSSVTLPICQKRSWWLPVPVHHSGSSCHIVSLALPVETAWKAIGTSFQIWSPYMNLLLWPDSMLASHWNGIAAKKSCGGWLDFPMFNVAANIAASLVGPVCPTASVKCNMEDQKSKGPEVVNLDRNTSNSWVERSYYILNITTRYSGLAIGSTWSSPRLMAGRLQIKTKKYSRSGPANVEASQASVLLSAAWYLDNVNCQVLDEISRMHKM